MTALGPAAQVPDLPSETIRGGPLARIAALVVESTSEMVSRIVAQRRVLWATTRLELTRRYAGSALGTGWVVLQPALLLAIYLFTYMVVFRVRFPGYSETDYVLYVFCGLVPYLGFMESAAAACQVLRQNMHLVKNVMLPIELLPVRAVMVSMAGQIVSLVVVVVLAALDGSLSLHVLWLPLVVALQLLLLVGMAWILSALALALPDVSYFVNLGVTFLMFVSPIGFKLEMIPERYRMLVLLNPVYYVTEVYRDSILLGRWPSPGVAATYVVLCLGTFAAGAVFFRTFKDVLADYE